MRVKANIAKTMIYSNMLTITTGTRICPYHFTISAGIAAIGGVLFCNGVGRITPDVFNLYNAALTITQMIVSGRGTLIGPVGATFGLFYLTSALGGQSVFNNNLVLGVILIFFVLLVPKGVAPTIIDWYNNRRRPIRGRTRRRRRRERRGESA